MIYALDLLGTLVFALSGALKGVRRELDLLGIAVLAVLTGVGGGLIRDVLLGATPPAAFRDETYFGACLLGALLIILGRHRITRRWNWVMVADGIGLGLFAALGASKAAVFGLGPLGVLMMGGLTAVGGGVVRDVLVGDRPAVLYKGFYATAALLGAAVLLLTRMLGAGESVQLVSAATVTTALRFAALEWNVQLPKPTLPDSPPAS